MHWPNVYALLFCLLAIAGCSREEQAPALIADTLFLAEEMAAVEGAPPGYAIIVTTGEGESFVYAAGVLNHETKTLADEHSAFYIASVTKSFVGLLGAIHEARGDIDLDQPVSVYMPRLVLPPPLDPSTITGYDLLSHQSRIENGSLIELTAFAGAPDDDAFYDILEKDTVVLDAPFTYANEGYVLYGQMVKEELGEDWRAALGKDVLAPLGMNETFTRTSAAPAGKIAFGHILTEEGWVTMPPKADSIMHAAGGIFMSPHDAEIWLSAMIDPQSAASASGIPLAAFEDMSAPHANQDRTLINFKREHYGLGWNISEYEGDIVYEHGGGYTGHRSFFAFMPGRKIGVAVMTNGDGAALRFAIALVENAFDEVLNRDGLAERHAYRLDEFKTRTARTFEEQKAERAKILAVATWKPDRAALSRYEGVYAHERLGDMVVTLGENGLKAHLGEDDMMLYPASKQDEFLLVDAPFDTPIEETSFELREDCARPCVMIWYGDAFERVGDGP